jgi:hypothetical protein
MNAMPRIALTAASFFFFAYEAYAHQAAQEKTGLSRCLSKRRTILPEPQPLAYRHLHHTRLSS